MENQASARAKRVLMKGNSGAAFPDVAVDADGHLQVDVLSGGGGGSSEHAEDTTHTSGDTGVLLLAVRNDTPSLRTDADQDYSPISVDSRGRVQVAGSAGAAAVIVTAGSIQANAGTNLNTSLLALESGGNLAAAAASLAAMDDWDDGADRAKVTGSAGMAALICTVGGQVTANAGTNLNTSLLALESGGNLAAAAASLAVLDDWDESDRAKVNPIAGQAGVAAGDGVVNSLTQRVTMGLTEATFGSAELSAVNLTSTTVWTEALATPTNAWRLLELVNTSDVDMQFSANASNAHWKLSAGHARSIDLFANGLKISTAISARNDGTTATRGQVHVSGLTT